MWLIRVYFTPVNQQTVCSQCKFSDDFNETALFMWLMVLLKNLRSPLPNE